jgi:3,4-dihydroxy 2-butanone 4-phosphate synthase/GTP cyclohydrolase II
MTDPSLNGDHTPNSQDPLKAMHGQRDSAFGHESCGEVHEVLKRLEPPSSALAQEVLSAVNYSAGSALKMEPDSRPTRGQTTCLGKMDLKLEYGEFSAYLFRTRDVNGYVIALAKGDITTNDNLLVRTHSECITSETLNACDCDCVEQLNGALEQIATEGRGVLFYLRQEGRGAGYEAKATDRMMVIASKDELGTFEAYNAMGLPRDARDYSSINDIVYLLGINAGLEVMTNNPRKITGLQEHGLKVAGTRPHSFQAGPFNIHYMNTKAAVEKHSFDPKHIKRDGADDHVYPENQVHRSYVLSDARRFIHRATYWLPIRPPANERILDTSVMVELNTAANAVGTRVLKSVEINQDRPSAVKVTLDDAAMRELRARNPQNAVDALLARHPYFFNNHVYLDENTNLVYPVLQHESKLAPNGTIPAVRIHTESILGRLPLADNSERDTFRESVQMIVENGAGLVLLYPKDGRGNGIGSVFEEADLIKRGAAKSTQEACKIMGTPFDGRDYTAVARLIKHHYPSGTIDIILSPAEDNTQRATLFKALADEGISIREYLTVD